mgnify:CR=1 FL=1
MATQATLFPSGGVATADPFLPVQADTAITDHGDSGRPPGPVAVHDAGVDLAKKTVCIKLRLSTMGNTRKVSTSQIEADADKDLLRVSKFRRVICDCLPPTWKLFVC